MNRRYKKYTLRQLKMKTFQGDTPDKLKIYYLNKIRYIYMRIDILIVII